MVPEVAALGLVSFTGSLCSLKPQFLEILFEIFLDITFSAIFGHYVNKEKPKARKNK